MNKKGFTLVELLAVIVILGVISTIAVISYNGVIQNSRNKAYKDDETSLRSAAENLLTFCAANTENISYCIATPSYNQTITVTLDQLISGNFIDKIVDNAANGNACTGYVKITNTSNESLKLDYKTCLICGNYKSSECE